MSRHTHFPQLRLIAEFTSLASDMLNGVYVHIDARSTKQEHALYLPL